MSSVDTSLRNFWNLAFCFNQGGEQHWLTFIELMADRETGIAQRAATNFIARNQKVAHESATG